MNKKLYLIAGVLIFIVFVDRLFDSESIEIFGILVNIWVVRLGWLALSISCFVNYFKLKKS